MLGPTKLPQSPRRVPYLAHFCDLAFVVHRQRVDIVRNRLPLGRRDGATFTDMGARKSPKKYRRAVRVVIRGTVQFVRTSFKRTFAESRHPFAIFFDRPDIRERFALGGKWRSVRNVVLKDVRFASS